MCRCESHAGQQDREASTPATVVIYARHARAALALSALSVAGVAGLEGTLGLNSCKSMLLLS